MCRRHHRVKQLGWTKQRTAHGVRWTSPTLRQALSPPQTIEVPTLRPARPVPASGLAGLSPAEHEDALHPTDPHFAGCDSPDPGCGPGQRAGALAEQRWWARQLAALRRETHRTPH